MKKGKEPICLIDFWMQETVKELTTCVYFICTIWSSDLCTSESHAPLCACTSFALSGRWLSKNRTPATISTRLLHALSPKPSDASQGESRLKGAMKWKRPEHRRESRRGSFPFQRCWCLAAAPPWFRQIQIKLLTSSQSLASKNRSSTWVLFLSSCSLCFVLCR